MTDVATRAEADEIARSLDASLTRILSIEALLESAEHDRPLPDALQDAVVGLGWSGVAVAEDDGGLGLGPTARAMLGEVAGRRLLPAAVRGEALLLAPALAALGAADLLEGVLAGELRGGGAIAPAFAADGDGASQLVALAPGARLAALVGTGGGMVVDLEADPVSVEPAAGLEAGQGLARVTVTGPIAPERCFDDAVSDRLRDGWELWVFAELAGTAARTLELSAEYAQQREQFGRKIVTFQAVSHRLAEMAVALGALDSAIGRLAAGLEDGRPDPLLAAVLRHVAPAKARTVCESAIQVHGGIGFTWELGLHLHLRRALDLQYALGGDGPTAQAIGERYVAARAEVAA
jgi:alkylation response protein AidB-like acyl-CoA dehydrogenase